MIYGATLGLDEGPGTDKDLVYGYQTFDKFAGRIYLHKLCVGPLTQPTWA